MPLTFKGTIVPGNGLASTNYPILIPLLAKHCPGIRDCGKFGTINVSSDRPFDPTHADCWTPSVRWTPKFGLAEQRDEMFGFISISFQLDSDRTRYEGWAIICEGVIYSYSGEGFELIFDQFIPEVEYNKRCVIELDRIPSRLRPIGFGKRFGR